MHPRESVLVSSPERATRMRCPRSRDALCSAPGPGADVYGRRPSVIVGLMDYGHLGPRLDARPLFAPELAALLGTLRALPPDAWWLEAVPGWTVHDVAAHLLGDCYGRLSRGRDGYGAGPTPSAGEPLPRFIDRLNQ